MSTTDTTPGEGEQGTERMPVAFGVTIDGDAEAHYFPGDDGGQRIMYESDRANGYELSGPLSWMNSAGISFDPDGDAVHLSVSTGDPRGAFTMTLRRIPDGDHPNAGRVIMHAPHPDDSTPHESLREIHPGTYMVGG